MTGQFRTLAAEASFEDRVILTHSVVDEARYYLGGQELSPKQVKDLVERLKHEDKFGSARKVFAKVRETQIPSATLRTWFAQQHALCTYKDPDLPVLKALDQALAILQGSFDVASTFDQETLGIAGGIYKRRWQATGQKDQLERSHYYYRRGFDVGLEKDKGYTAINAAFVLDQLADIEMADGTPSVDRRRTEAKEIREAVVAKLPPERSTNPELNTDWWYLVTVADALFGLGRYDEAETCDTVSVSGGCMGCRCGSFYWRQAHNALGAGATMIYNAMFDEVDEGTAMFKLAPTTDTVLMLPHVVTQDADGCRLPND